MGNVINTKNINAVMVFIDREKTRSYVGKLTYGSPSSGQADEGDYFYFEYDSTYLQSSSSLRVGPELPLESKLFTSKQLFASFADRIPSRANAAYPDYCEAAGITPLEKDPLVLLSTIGSFGPSSFVFVPTYEEKFLGWKVKKYREKLNLTLREFAVIFSLSHSHLQRVETGQFPGKEIVRLIEICENHPAIAIEQVRKNGARIPAAMLEDIIEKLSGPH